MTLTTNQKVAMNSPEAATISLYDFNYYQIVEGVRTDYVRRHTDFSEEVYYNTNLYTPVPMKRSEFKQSSDGKIEDVTLSIANIDQDREIQQIIENYEIIGSDVTVYEFFIDPSTGLTIDTPIVNTFKVKGAKATKGQVDFSLSIGFDFFNSKLPARQFLSKFCRWKRFKDSYCKYAGSDTTCDRTFDACQAKGNVINFGGAPGILTQRLYF